MTSIEPFTVNVSDETINKIEARVAAYPWHEMPSDGGWEAGTNLDYMKEFCDYWVTDFDWRKQEANINRFAHFKTPIDGIDIHFIHEKGSGANPKPLIISHGCLARLWSSWTSSTCWPTPKSTVARLKTHLM